MESIRDNGVARRLVGYSSRRGALAAMIAGSVAALGITDSEARRRCPRKPVCQVTGPTAFTCCGLDADACGGAGGQACRCPEGTTCVLNAADQQFCATI